MSRTAVMIYGNKNTSSVGTLVSRMQDKHESQHLTKVKSNTLHTALVNRKIQTLKTLDSSPLKTLLFGLFEIGLSDKE